MEGSPTDRKFIVVADPTREFAAALQYALSHVVVHQDELILVHVANPHSWKNALSSFLRLPNHYSSSSSGSSSAITDAPAQARAWARARAPGEVQFLDVMKRICRTAQPRLKVRVECIQTEGSKASAILYLGDRLGVELIVIGQRWILSSAILGSRRPGGSLKGGKSVDTAEYLIENSKCICVGVQKKGQNAGYLLNTKKHKNFWLLA